MKKTFNLWSSLGDQEENDTEEFFMDSRKASKDFEMFKMKICKSDRNIVHLQRYSVRQYINLVRRQGFESSLRFEPRLHHSLAMSPWEII